MTANRPCIIWGGTGQAKVAYDILNKEGSEIVHLFDNNINVKSPFPEIPISYGIEGLLFFVQHLASKGIKTSGIDCIAAIAGANGEAREAMTAIMESQGFAPRSLIHHTSIISPSAHIGKSVQILAGATIGASASIGDYAIINSGANVDHDSKIGKCCHLAPNAALAGEVVVQDNVFVGTNATILPRVIIHSGATVGAGAVVTKNVMSSSVVIGNPARILNTYAD